MPSVSTNNLAGFLAVYAQESLDQFIAGMPNVNLFTKNFSSEIAGGGLSVVTRIPSTVWGVPNDLTAGWGSTAANSTAITTTLKLRDYDIVFNELEWATITPTVLTKLYLPSLVKQMANGIVVDAINNVTVAAYTSTVTVTNASSFALTGSNSLQTIATTLSNNEVDEEGRFAIVSPLVYQGLTQNITPTYYFGSDELLTKNKVQELLGFSVIKYPRFFGASIPQGGSKVTNTNIVGIAGNKQGLVLAVRSPVEINNGLVQSSTATDPTSGLSLQVRMLYDASLPGWRLAVVSVFGTSAGNTKAIMPIVATAPTV